MLSASPESIGQDQGVGSKAPTSPISPYGPLQAQSKETAHRLSVSSASSLSPTPSPSSPVSPAGEGSNTERAGAQLVADSRKPRKLARYSRPSSATSEALHASPQPSQQDAMMSTVGAGSSSPYQSGLQLFNLPLFIHDAPHDDRPAQQRVAASEEAAKKATQIKAQRASSLRHSPHASLSPGLGDAGRSTAARSRSLRVALPTNSGAEQESSCTSSYYSPARSDRALPYAISRESSEDSEASSASHRTGGDASIDWLHSSRRWSSSISHSRSAKMFRQAASPYLRAGLEELKSIFDVDSDPVPSSPFEDDEGDDTVHESDSEDSRSASTFSEIESGEGGRREGSSASSASRASNLRRLLRGSSASERRGHSTKRTGSRSPRVSPSGLIPHMERPSLLPTSVHSSMGPSERRSKGASSSPRLPTSPLLPRPLQSSRTEPIVTASSLGLSAEEKESILQSANLPQAVSSSEEKMGASVGCHRGGAVDDVLLAIPCTEKGARTPVLEDCDVRRRQVAVGLALTAIGIVAACAFGERFFNDTFSASLLIFFLVQPAFALLGLAALLARKRAVMDLFSRAMRAHVLLQAIIALLAFFDLSASASYVRKSALGGAHSWVMELIPSMQSRFGPWTSPWDASTAPGAALLSEAAHASQGEAQLHAHDTTVGSLSSRMTHFVIFLVQAAAPLLLALWAQFHLARALGILARSPSLRRGGSLRAPSRRTSMKQRPASSGGRGKRRLSHAAKDAIPPVPAFDVAELSSRLQRIDAGAASSRNGRTSKTNTEQAFSGPASHSRVGQHSRLPSVTLPSRSGARSQRVSLLASPTLGQGFTYGLEPPTPDPASAPAAFRTSDVPHASPRNRTWSHRDLSPISASSHALPLGAPGVVNSPRSQATAKLTESDARASPAAEQVGLPTSPANMHTPLRAMAHKRDRDHERHHNRSLSQPVVVTDSTKALLAAMRSESQRTLADPVRRDQGSVIAEPPLGDAARKPRHSDAPHS